MSFYYAGNEHDPKDVDFTRHGEGPIGTGEFIVLCVYADDGKIHEHPATWDGERWSCFDNPAAHRVLGWKKAEE